MTTAEAVTVTVASNGQVTVNDVLVAEVRLGTEVATQQDLQRELSLHRTADVVLERLSTLIDYLELGTTDGPAVLPNERGDFGAAMIAGLLGEPGELTGRKVYRDGHRTGTSLRVLHGHLAHFAGKKGRTGWGAVDATRKAYVSCPICGESVEADTTGSADPVPRLADALRYHLLVEHAPTDAATITLR